MAPVRRVRRRRPGPRRGARGSGPAWTRSNTPYAACTRIRCGTGPTSTWPVPDGPRRRRPRRRARTAPPDRRRRTPGVVTVESGAAQGRCGPGRGVAAAPGLGAASAEQVWIANTDADSRVPADWLTHQLDCAHDGADVVLRAGGPRRRGVRAGGLQRCGPRPTNSATGIRTSTGRTSGSGRRLPRCGGFGPAGAHEDVRAGPGGPDSGP